MGITITLISGNEDEAAVFSEAYCGHLSSVFRFDLDVSEPLSTSSRIVTCFHKIEVDDEKKTFPDRVSLRQAIRGSTSHVRPICASNPSICLPEFVIQIQHDDHDETTCKISHECAFHKYLASLLPIASVKDALIRKGRGGTTTTRFRDRKERGSYVYKGLSFHLFLEDDAGYKSERHTFYHELGAVFSLPSHQNILLPSYHGVGEEGHVICGALYPFFDRQSLHKVINQSNESHTSLSLVAKAKWAFQLSSAMAIVHLSGQYHMDLKPSNMLLNNDDDVVVIDWEQCGASPFFLAPEGNGLWDVEICECPRALEAAEVYSVGRSLWAIFEQSDDVWVYKRGHSETKAVVWTHGSDSVPEAWKDFVSRCMNLDPNKRPTFEQGERFWGQEWKKHEGNTK
ncbi:putative serine/threonine protein kinase, variant 1 [Trichoderma asperelloides]|nr:putative serine/threonine protein kinase, variant 1 [Trichoderma asperelloides]